MSQRGYDVGKAEDKDPRKRRSSKEEKRGSKDEKRGSKESKETESAARKHKDPLKESKDEKPRILPKSKDGPKGAERASRPPTDTLGEMPKGRRVSNSSKQSGSPGSKHSLDSVTKGRSAVAQTLMPLRRPKRDSSQLSTGSDESLERGVIQDWIKSRDMTLHSFIRKRSSTASATAVQAATAPVPPPPPVKEEPPVEDKRPSTDSTPPEPGARRRRLSIAEPILKRGTSAVDARRSSSSKSIGGDVSVPFLPVFRNPRKSSLQSAASGVSSTSGGRYFRRDAAPATDTSEGRDSADEGSQKVTITQLRMDEMLEKRRGQRIQLLHALGTAVGRAERSTRIAASLVPDEILLDVHNRTVKHFDSVLLLGDISGFTDLTERYTRMAKGGTSRLTAILNSYIGSMVQVILERSGDVLKFSGDAYLVMWKFEGEETTQDYVTRALDCACEIQKSYGTRATEVGVQLGVKLAISCGPIAFNIIGDDFAKHYIILGDPLWDLKKAGYEWKKGDVLVTMHAWQYVNTKDYLHEVSQDGKHVRVLGVGPTWVRQNVGSRAVARSQEREFSTERNNFLQEERPTRSDAPSTDDEGVAVASAEVRALLAERGLTGQELEELPLRPAIAVSLDADMLPLLRPFIIKPVLRGLDLDEPLEYLTEMRQVVVVFLNVVMKMDEVDKFFPLVDHCYRHSCRLAEAVQGCVNKVSLFDKDLMILIIFGLRGFKTAREAQIALRCAADVRAAFRTWDPSLSVAAGVTSGIAYCGVVGHAYRREYTVIGGSVNKAARMMTAYPDKVTCDQDTYLDSRLETFHFSIMEERYFKGMRHVGTIYEFVEQAHKKDSDRRGAQWPLLGRDIECRLFEEQFITMKERIEDNMGEYSSDPREKLRWANRRQNTILIESEPRQGKTRLIEEFFHIAKNYPRFSVSLLQRDAALPYSGLRQLMLPALKLPLDSTRVERQKVLGPALEAVGVNRAYMCVVNPIFDVTFPITLTFRNLQQSQRLLAQRIAIERLAMNNFPPMSLACIDDADFLDTESWRLLRALVELDVVFIVIAISNHLHKLAREAQELMSERWRVSRVRLKPLDKWYHAALACQMLDVWAIPPELEKICHQHSGGNPGWVESYLIGQVHKGTLQICMMASGYLSRAGLVTPPLYLLTRAAQAPEKQENLFGEDDLTGGGGRDNIRSDRWTMYRTTVGDSGDEGSPDEATPTNSVHTVNTGVAHTMARGSRPSKALINLLAERRRTATSASTSMSQGALPGPDIQRELWVAACVRPPGRNLEEPHSTCDVNVLIMQTLDSLNPFEQLLLKCSSVIGDTFPRKMMLAMMGASSFLREVALAVKHLFEIRVLECASRSPIPSSQDRDDPLWNLCTCQVRMDELPEECVDLPKFAHCEMMRFRSAQYRDTTYSLLTEAQMREYHLAAILYIEINARRCVSCGGDYFPLALTAAARAAELFHSNMARRGWRDLGSRRGSESSKSDDSSSEASFEEDVEIDLEAEHSDDRILDFGYYERRSICEDEKGPLRRGSDSSTRPKQKRHISAEERRQRIAQMRLEKRLQKSQEQGSPARLRRMLQSILPERATTRPIAPQKRRKILKPKALRPRATATPYTTPPPASRSGRLTNYPIPPSWTRGSRASKDFGTLDHGSKTSLEEKELFSLLPDQKKSPGVSQPVSHVKPADVKEEGWGTAGGIEGTEGDDEDDDDDDDEDDDDMSSWSQPKAQQILKSQRRSWDWNLLHDPRIQMVQREFQKDILLEQMLVNTMRRPARYENKSKEYFKQPFLIFDPPKTMAPRTMNASRAFDFSRPDALSAFPKPMTTQRLLTDRYKKTKSLKDRRKQRKKRRWKRRLDKLRCRKRRSGNQSKQSRSSTESDSEAVAAAARADVKEAHKDADDSKLPMTRRFSSAFAEQASLLRLPQYKLLKLKGKMPELPPNYPSFPANDFRSCKCNEILFTLYDSLLRHSMGANLPIRIMELLLDYAEFCLMLDNQPLALRLLREAQTLLAEQARSYANEPVNIDELSSDDEVPETNPARKSKRSKDPKASQQKRLAAQRKEEEKKSIPKFHIPYIYARIQMLIGQTRISMGQTEKGAADLLRALRAFQCKYPLPRLRVYVSLQLALMRQKTLLGRLRSAKRPLHRGFYARCAVYESQCLCLLCDYFVSEGNMRRAQLAATLALNGALQLAPEWITLCNALARMLEARQRAREWGPALILERITLHTFTALLRVCPPDDLWQVRASGRLVATLARLRVQRGELEASHALGSTALRIASGVDDTETRCEMLVLLVETLIIRGEIEHSAMMLHQLEYLCDKDASREDTYWFYAMCLVTVSFAGFDMVPLHKLFQFMTMERSRIWKESSGGPARRLCVCNWIWHIRREEWPFAITWGDKLREHPPAPNYMEDVREAITELMRLEALLLMLVHHIDERELDAASQIASEVKSLDTALWSLSHRVRAIKPCLLLLRGYRRRIRYNDRTALSLVRKGRSLAVKQDNKLWEARCRISERVWTGEATDEELCAWRESCEEDYAVSWKDVCFHGAVMPLPVLLPPRHRGGFRL